MAQPPAYERTKDFTEQNGNDTDHEALNSELDRVSITANAIRFNLAILQADDGRLRPNVVTYDSLSEEIIDDISADVRADVQGELDRAEAAAVSAEAASASANQQANRAEAAANGIDQKLQQATAAASSATASASAAQQQAINASGSAQSASNAAANAAAAASQAVEAAFPSGNPGQFLGLDSEGDRAYMDVKALPDGTKKGQSIVWNPETGKWEPGFISSVPVGVISHGRGPDADVGYIKLAEDVLTYWPIAGFEGKGITDLVTRCYVGDALNDTALAYFKCDVTGTVRSTTGDYFALPSEGMADTGLRIVREGTATVLGGSARYIVYSNGDVYQWGNIPTQSESSKTITFPVKMVAGTAVDANRNTAYVSPAAGALLSLRDITGTSATTYTHTAEIAGSSWSVYGKADPSEIPQTLPGILQIKAWDDASIPAGMDVQEVVNAITDMVQPKANRSEVPGINQSWQDVTASRMLGSEYINATGKSIEVVVGVTLTNAVTFTRLVVDGVDASKTQGYAGGSYTFELRADVPAGSTYQVTGGSPTLSTWRELRGA